MRPILFPPFPSTAAMVQWLRVSADDEAMEVRGRFAHHGTVVGDDDVWVALHVERLVAGWRNAIDAVLSRLAGLGLRLTAHLDDIEIGGVLGVTESRVCQIHTKAILQLRGRLQDPPG